MSKVKRWSHPLVTVLGVICLILLGACEQSSPSIGSTLQPSPTPVVLPEFLSLIYPKSREVIAQERLSVHHVSGSLRLEKIAEPNETLELGEIQERIEFLIDRNVLETRVSQDLWPGIVDVRPIKKSALGLGEHKATIRVRRTSGKVLEYSWTFTVLAEEPTLSGLPEGLQFVRPLPDSTSTLRTYREEQLVPRYYFPGFADLRGGVCVGILPEEIVEPGEFLDGLEVADKYSIVALDGVYPGASAIIEGAYEPCKGPIYDESGNIVGSYVGPHHYECWRVELDPGRHKATVRLRRASGEVDYTWVFTITNN